MNKRLNDLPLRKKFMLLQLLFMITLVSVFVVLLVTFRQLNGSQKQIEDLHELRASLYSLRVSLNAQRGEVLINSIASYGFDGVDLAESKRSYRHQKMVLDSLNKFIEARINESNFVALKRSYPPLLTSIRPLVTMMDEHMSLVSSANINALDSEARNDLSTFIARYDPRFVDFRNAIQKILSEIEHANHLARKEYTETKATAINILSACFIISAVVTYFLSRYIAMSILKPIMLTRDTLASVSNGELPDLKMESSQDETGQMLRSLQLLVRNLTNLKHFTSVVGSGTYDDKTEVFNNQGPIAHALLHMRENLKTAARKEFEEKWIATGLSQMTTILRNDRSNTQSLYDDVLRFFVKYLNANQGTFYIARKEFRETHLDRISSYAYDKKKVVDGSVAIGDGLVGQAYLEKEIIYITEVPKNYIKITSGLGEATPRVLAILPLIHNNEVKGIMEIASFVRLADYQFVFMRQFANIIAAEMHNIETAIQTRSLLEQAQQQSEQLKAQEEELRQSIEELQTTQEEMARRFKDARVMVG